MPMYVQLNTYFPFSYCTFCDLFPRMTCTVYRISQKKQSQLILKNCLGTPQTHSVSPSGVLNLRLKTTALHHLKTRKKSKYEFQQLMHKACQSQAAKDLSRHTSHRDNQTTSPNLFITESNLYHCVCVLKERIIFLFSLPPMIYYKTRPSKVCQLPHVKGVTLHLFQRENKLKVTRETTSIHIKQKSLNTMKNGG